MFPVSSDVVVIAGPTASGKSWLAANLGARMNGVVINADSQQLYNALPILTARPGPDLTNLCPHLLYGVIAPTIRVTAKWWADEARMQIATALDEGCMPIVVGGTGLYLEALMQGIAPIPDVPIETREQTRRDFDAMGREEFYARLIAADPASALLNPGDTQRTLRAWEVYSATGRAIGYWQSQGKIKSNLDFHSIVILPLRETQRQACDARFVQMVEQGAVEEVAAFLQSHDRDVPASRVLGFAALADCLNGKITRAEAIELAQAETRQYAKRQATWFRNRFQKTTLFARVFEAVDEDVLLQCVDFFT